jgi:hypothetical protein
MHGAAGGFHLSETQFGGPTCQLVYWLPWQLDTATTVKRSVFETKCQFFMTSAMTGCRLTVTPTEILHVANSAMIWEGAFTQSQARTNFEQIRTGPRHRLTRRLSVSAPGHANDSRYGGGGIGVYHRALVFGIRLYTGQWTYKVFHSHPAPGSWSIM